jgi:HEAT repeat protein
MSVNSGAALIETVRALGIAAQRLSVYPPGHPARQTAVENAHRSVAEAAAVSGRVLFGVGPDGFVLGAEALQSPQARRLAQALYQRSVAVLAIEDGVAAAEIEALLRLLGEERGATERAPLWEELAAAGAPHVQLQPVDYSSVSLTQEPIGEEPAQQESLSDAILRVLMAGKHLSLEGRDIRSPDAASGLGALIAEQLRQAVGAGAGSGEAAGRATGPAAAGSLAAAIAEAVGTQLQSARGSARQATAQQVAELVRSLPMEMREGVVSAAIRSVAADETDPETLQALVPRLSPDVVLRGLRRLNAEGFTLSSHAFRLTEALAEAAPAAQEEQEEPGAATPETDQLVSELRTLYAEEDVDRYNADDHEALFERVAVEVAAIAEHAPVSPAELGDRLDSLSDEASAERLSWTLLELLGRHVAAEDLEPLFARIEGLFRLFLSTGGLEQAVAIAERVQEILADPACPEGVRGTLQEFVARLASQDTILALVELLHGLTDERAALVKYLIDLLGSAAARGFLFALSEEKNRSRRRRLFLLLASLGPVIVPAATELLSDERWYVVRNMVSLLHAVGDRSSLPGIRRCARHPDLRVRLEAIKSLFAFDSEVPQELLEAAIADPDPKLAEAAVALVGQYGIAQAVGALVGLVSPWDPLGRRRSLRLKALKALGELHDAAALPRLERFFKDHRFFAPVALEERRAAFRSLESYPAEARLPIVERGLRSRDPEIRRTCERLARLGLEEARAPEAES